jgi:signal peptidase I
MEDNLLTGDHIVVNKAIYAPQLPVLRGLLPLREPRRGDVVVFRYPEDPRVDFVKRVVAMPGETLLIRDKRVFIDGKELPEPYVLFTDERTQHPSSPYHRDHFGPFKVPAGEYFTMGDNRDNSHDSRFWGTVPRAMIKGRAFVVYWSFELEGRPRNRLHELVMVIKGFFPNTRWRRTFFVVDREFHYGK